MKNRIVIFIFMILMTACHSRESQTIPNATPKFCIPDSLRNQVTTDTVAFRPVTEELKLTGNITFDQDKVVKLYPMVSGNVLQVKVALGDRVEKGEVLAVIRSVEIAGAENDIVNAEADLAVAEKNLAASDHLYKSGIASEKEYLEALKQVEKSRSALNKVKTVLSIYGGNQSNYIVRSPVSGYIVEKFINPDMQIRPDNTTGLFTISDLKKIWVLANVYESDIAGIKEGEPVSVTTISYPDKVFNGSIDKIYSVLDPDNKTLRVRIRLDNPDNLLKPEMFANVMVHQVRDTAMLAVPANSVVFDRNRYWVLVYNSPCDIRVRQVEMVMSSDLFTYIRSGVKPGERVITNRQLLIYNALVQ
ncbi:MAG: efflux RND transporter periplasmic adaptor subunit [Bacteroidota bacterium]